MPHRFSNAYSSGTECRIYPKPGCKFEFVRCLKVYETKLTNLDPEGTLEGPFYQGSPEISLAGSFLRSILGSMMVQEGPLSPVRVTQFPKRCSRKVRGARLCIKCKNGIHNLK